MVVSSKVRVALACGWPLLLLWLVPEKSTWAKPVFLIALGLPLMFRLVPKNWLYGMRTLRTLRGSDETWYRQNVITGIALVITGVVWLATMAIRFVH